MICLYKLTLVKQFHSQCTVSAVLVRFTEHITLFVTLFYLRLHESVLNLYFTISSDALMTCLGAVLDAFSFRRLLAH
jgi:hypothetical protein